MNNSARLNVKLCVLFLREKKYKNIGLKQIYLKQIVRKITYIKIW